MIVSSNSIVVAFASSSVTTTLCVGESGVKSARTMNVTNADSSANPTVIGPRMRLSPRLAGALASAVSAVAACSTLICPCRGSGCGGSRCTITPKRALDWPFYGLMLLYNNVAKLRQNLDRRNHALRERWGICEQQVGLAISRQANRQPATRMILDP